MILDNDIFDAQLDGAHASEPKWTTCPAGHWIPTAELVDGQCPDCAPDTERDA